MTVRIDIELAQAIQRIKRARDLADKRYRAFYDACAAYDWALADKMRLEIIATVESFTDETAAIHKFLEENSGGKNKKR